MKRADLLTLSSYCDSANLVLCNVLFCQFIKWLRSSYMPDVMCGFVENVVFVRVIYFL